MQNSPTQAQAAQPISRRRRAATTGGPSAYSSQAITGLKMLFDHDHEEEEELAAIEALQGRRTGADGADTQPKPRVGLSGQNGRHATGPTAQTQGEDSSSSSAEDEEKLRTDIIKYKKKLKKDQERAQKKEEKALARQQQREEQRDWRKAFKRQNGFLANKDLPESRRPYQPQLPSLYFENDSDLTESEKSGDDENPTSQGGSATLNKGKNASALDKHQKSKESGDSSPVDDSLSDSVQEDALRHPHQQPEGKKPLKGVLAIKNVKSQKTSFRSIDEKFAYLQRRLKLEEQIRQDQIKEKQQKKKKVKEEEDNDAADFLDELIDQNLAIQDDDLQEQEFLENILSLQNAQDPGVSPIGDQLEVEVVESRAHRSNEDQHKYLKLQEELRFQRRLMKRRYETRHDIDDFVRVILNVEILDRYANTNSRMGLGGSSSFSNRPSDFDEYVLPTNFEQGHYEYIEKWEYLFMYETYSMMLNSRRSDAKEEDYTEQQNQANLKNDKDAKAKEEKKQQENRVAPRTDFTRKRKLKWVCYIVCSQKDMLFQNIRMYEEPPHANDPAAMKPQHAKSDDAQIRQLREHDLVILSEEQIDLNGHDDIKKVCNIDFLRALLFKHNAMFAFVTKKAQSSKGGASGSACLQVDISKALFLEMAESENSYAKMYCYHYENLATTVREYKTLKMCEFYKMAPILLYPSLALENKDQMLADHEKTLGLALGQIGPNGEKKQDEPFIPMRHAKNVVETEDIETQMRKYAKRNRKLYNPSQLIVLDKVIDMPQNDILLIQGPPGTGKTHTITGIISMLLSSGIKKILVCAPSNAAVDEIISRLSSKGFIGEPDPGAKDSILEQGNTADGMLLRIGAVEYEPSPDVAKHTLDKRLIETLNGNKAYELKEKIDFAKDLLNDIKSSKEEEGGGYLTTTCPKHVQYLYKLVSHNVKRVKEFIKKKTKEEHVEFLKRTLEANERKLGELLSGENTKQGSDWKYYENNIILKSQIICCTLAISGQEKLEALKDTLDYLIVDEACQCIEPSTLIPFELGPKRVILVGDQNQLPATTFSDNSINTHFSRSLFERLLQSGYDRTMLEVQYRMHPSIRKFPSKQFYGNRLSDHESIPRRKLSNPLQNLEKILGARMIFFNLKDSRETVDDRSKRNVDEAEFTKQLVEFIAYNSTKSGTLRQIAGAIGVISPYKSQVRQLKNRIGPLCRSQDCSLRETVEVNTVDAFQGREKDIIIFNCVRSNFSQTLQGSLGFLTDYRRLNVAITRPRHFLLVIGNAQTLEKSEVWNNMMTHCKNRAKFITIASNQIYRKASHAVNLQADLPQLLRSCDRAEDSSSDASNPDVTTGQEVAKKQSSPTDTDFLLAAASSKDSTACPNLFPDNQAKNDLVRGLYKRATTQQQREELDQMVNEERYFELKRQKQ